MQPEISFGKVTENLMQSRKSTLVWDFPVRLCHWLVVILVAAQWLTAEILEDAIQWHAWLGYSLLGVVLFRLAWGFLGTHYARFNQFIAPPSRGFQYVKLSFQGKAPVYTGHNPLGGWMALLLLLLLLVQGISGVFMTDDIFFFGPYYYAVGSNTQNLMNSMHHLVFDVIKYAVLIHVIAALVYVFYRKQPLIKALFTGKKPVNAASIIHSRWLFAIPLALIIACLLYFIIVVWAPVPEDIWSF